MNIYPWQKSAWVEVFSNKLKMPHAYIFYGAQGTESHKFVDELIKSVLCSSPSSENFACRKCQDCLWSETNHPDLKVVESALDRGEKVSTDTLNVANAREVKNFLELTPHQENGKKIVVIYGAERLTIASSNALLKTIEEPPNNCLIIFTVNNLANLLPTITSRCRLIAFSKPNIKDAEEFLRQSDNANLIDNLSLFNNSPLELINNKEMLSNVYIVIGELKKGDEIDLMKVNSIWLNNGLVWIINILQKWAYELLLCKLSDEHNYFPSDKEVVRKLALNADLSKLLIYQNSLNTIKSYAQKAVNKEINLNSVMIEYKNIFTN